MDCELTFKKAFGITHITTEVSIWLDQLKHSTVQVKSGDQLFHVSYGLMGETLQEKWAISRFLDSDERRPELISPIPTLNFTTKLSLEIPASVYARRHIPGVVDTIVEPFIDSAFVAYQHFAEAYRDTQYLAAHGTPQWYEQRGVFVRMPSRNDFTTYLFYVLHTSDAVTFVGYFSAGRILQTQLTNMTLQQRIQESLDQGGVRLERVLMVNAWEMLFTGDLRSSVITAATALERIVFELLTADMKRRKVSSTKIKEHFRNSNSTTRAAEVLDLFKRGDGQLKKRSADLINKRNKLVH